MNVLKCISVPLLALYLHLPVKTQGNPYIISDSRVRNLDVTPVLGRGYSIMTNSFQSTCLEVTETTIPSFNYDYEFFEMTASETSMATADASVQTSYAWNRYQTIINADIKKDSTSEKKTHYIIAKMRIERYYASVKESTSSISPMAMQLLDRQDYVSFFKACGPNYVRSIRRVQEVSALLKFESTSSEAASDYSYSVQTNYGYSDGYSQKASHASMNKTLQITVTAYGLGLTEAGSEALIATSLPEFNQIMKFAYNQMTKSPFANHVGMVFGIEVAPWIENIEFQISAGVQNEVIEIPQSKSLIPRAFKTADPTDFDFNNDNRSDYRCKDLTYAIDKYGYCCEYESLYSIENEEYDENNPEARVCRPIRQLDKAMIAENMASNGEFVARLDSALRYKTNQLATLNKCISAINGISTTLDHHFLIPQDSTNYDSSMEGTFTVFDMRMSLDPFGDYAMVQHMAQELDEYIEMFYSPCLAELFGTNIGKSSSTEASYFMAYPWHLHDTCSKMSCLSSNMRWDRKSGGCKPSLIGGGDNVDYFESEPICATDLETGDCKKTGQELNEFYVNLRKCWDGVLPTGNVYYFIENFCMPQVSGRALEEEAKDHLLNGKEEFCTLSSN